MQLKEPEKWNCVQIPWLHRQIEKSEEAAKWFFFMLDTFSELFFLFYSALRRLAWKNHLKVISSREHIYGFKCTLHTSRSKANTWVRIWRKKHLKSTKTLIMWIFFSATSNYCQKIKNLNLSSKSNVASTFIESLTVGGCLEEKQTPGQADFSSLHDFQFQSGMLYLATPWPFLITCGLPLEPFIMRLPLWDSHRGLWKKLLKNSAWANNSFSLILLFSF